MRYSAPGDRAHRPRGLPRPHASATRSVTSVDKANVLETFQLWKDVVTEVAQRLSGRALDHMYVDNAAMQLVKAPKAFDVIVTGNMFGDILSGRSLDAHRLHRHAALGQR